MLKKLRIKFVLINMCIVFAMLLVIFGMVYRFTAVNLENQSETMLQSLLQAAQQPGMYRENGDITLPYFTLQINAWGEVVASGTYPKVSDKAFVEQIARQVLQLQRSSGEIREYGLRYAGASSMLYQHFVFLDVSSHAHTLSALINNSIAIGFASLVIFLGISFALAWWAVKPVEKAWKQQRQFVSDASHELKTPLTVIMSNAELLQSEQCEPENKARFTENILTMSYHMRSLVEGLLELSRVDNGQVKTSFERLDMSKLVSDTLLPFEPVFFEQGLLLESEIEPQICVTGNGYYLRQAVEILLDNARKYSAPGVVIVHLQRQGKGRCVLSVANPGEPIPQQELERIFDRFYRTDKARSRDGSFGLGLAIAKSTVQEHQGKIWAQSNYAGNQFCIELPCE